MRKITDLRSAFPYEKSHLPSYPWLMAGPLDRKKIHIVGLGNVGQNAAVALRASAGETISRIGIYDTNQKLVSRMDIELNQILSPFSKTRYPEVKVLTENDLFDCDVFLLCAAAGVPSVGEETQGDVRMAQFEANRAILAAYAAKALREDYKGLFGVVSDPVDLLCEEAARFLHPEQVQGFGLGVMFARGAYYAAKRAPSDPRFSHFLQSGRVYGPNGRGLIAVNSISPRFYDSQATDKLTNLTVGANISIRALGYRPYIAPGVSSVALTIPEVISGNWNDSACFLNGIFFGARNRLTPTGIKWEKDPLPDELFYRLRESYRRLEKLKEKVTVQDRS